MIELWIVGRVLDPLDSQVWDILGVYSTEEQAKLACVDEDCFIGPAYLNHPMNPYPAVWEGCYYPKLETSSHIPLLEAVAKYGD